MVRVATWNLENLFRPGGAAGPRSKALADLVAMIDGDWRSELADPDRRGIRVGLLSRLPLSGVDQTAGFLDGLTP